MKKSTLGIALGMLAFAGMQNDAIAADAVAGKMAFETCRGCHSIPNYSNAYPTFYVPKVAGQRADYVVAALTAYKNKERPHGTMKANTYDLSAETIENIGAYLESMKKDRGHESPAKGDDRIGKKIAEACTGCHTESSKSASNTPRLAGQYGNYLVKAMKDYQSGKRKNALMQSMVKDLSNDDLENVAAYFAKKKGLNHVK